MSEFYPIEKFISIKQFGSFNNFQANSETQEFSKYNLFFGFNGSGKTTLSHLFEFLNLGNIPKCFVENGYRDEFEISNEKEIIKSFEFNPYIGKIKVFNREFVENNLSLNSDTAKTNAISYNVGKETKDIKDKIDKLNNSINKRYNQKKTELIITGEISNLNNKLDNKYRTIAESIRNELKILPASYKKNHFETDFEEFLNNETTITEDEKQSHINIYIQEEKEKIPQLNDEYCTTILSNEAYEQILLLLKTSIKRKSDLKEEIVNWIEKGVQYKTNDKCPFCNQHIGNWEERLLEIQEIIKKDDAYEIFEDQLTKASTTINALYSKAINFKINLRKEDFLSSLNVSEKPFENFNEMHKQYCIFLNSLKLHIDEKIKNKDNEIIINEDKNILNQYLILLQRLRDLIDKHNKGMDTQNELKRASRTIVIVYHIQKNKREILSLINKIKRLQFFEEKIKVIIEQYNKQIIELETILDNQTSSIAEIEKFIYIIFGKKYLKFEYESTTKSYIIKRENEKVACNLSEGEKTAVAFSYFLASLQDKDFNLQNGIVIIDDPVSSLDQQYLFNLINLLCNRFEKVNNFGQLFILTHNFYFYRKLRNILQNKQKSENDATLSLYEIKKQNYGPATSLYTNANKYLQNYESEYTYLIKQLRIAQTLQEDEYDTQMGNVIRRVLEIYLSFKRPTHKLIHHRFESILKNFPMEEKCKFKYLHDIANAASHTDESSDLSVLEEQKLKIGKREVDELFEFIRKTDNEHYSQLPKEISC